MRRGVCQLSLHKDLQEKTWRLLSTWEQAMTQIGNPLREIEAQPLELPKPLQRPAPAEPVPIEEPVEVPAK